MLVGVNLIIFYSICKLVYKKVMYRKYYIYMENIFY